ncbi:poly polymerase and DNA-ligase Zn-finger region-domain-containing protein [Leucosporidium creatinivorum]|uniref:Poly polymerase and DNA-ligase Zn-finger region-domain-containing protein n=1 Tax=Leucosporidium creatinivorum TaxID=106004 RepID=A0A1Y2F8L4_9BASI|nr:poly polymerase and DNA-ligase Zn-finger region-domain-containing protein [Leucosporidium creatinivorum]
MARGSSSRDSEWTPYQHSSASRAPAARMDDLHRLARLGDGVDDAYKIEYSPSGRAVCNGRQPCKGTKIAKGELRLGVWVDFGSEYGGSFKFHHWGCVTDRQLANMNVVFGGDASQLLGFNKIDSEDQQMVRKAFQTGFVDSDDRSALAPAPSPPPMATRSSPRKREHDEYQARYGGEGGQRAEQKVATSSSKEDHAEGELDATSGEPNDGQEEVKVEVEEPPKKRGRGRPKKVKLEEKEEVKPAVVDEGEAAVAPAEEEDVKPKTRARMRGKPATKVEEQVAVKAEEQVEVDVKPKRSLRLRKPPAHAVDDQFIHG